MIDLSTVVSIDTPKAVVRIESGNNVVWECPKTVRVVSLGDSIAAGHTINDRWETDYGYDSQYGSNGNKFTEIVPNSYTDLIKRDLTDKYGEYKISVKSFAKSGDTVADLIAKLSHDVVKYTISKADIVTICIGANDVLQPALSHLNEYINSGDLSSLTATVQSNLTILDTDDNANSYVSLFNKLVAINPNAKFVFTTVYNPYKYLWADEGRNGFFGPLLSTIPEITILGFEIHTLIKNGLLDTSTVKKLFSRINGLSAWAETNVNGLNTVIKNNIRDYNNPNFIVADSKVLFDTFPDRSISAPYHYNDLVSVEYTRGYDTAQMDWGRLWGDTNPAVFWTTLATRHVSVSGFDINGFVNELIPLIIDRVILPDTDPHPEEYGHYALKRSFADALGWMSLQRHTITFNANGGVGSMPNQTVTTLDGLTAYANINTNLFSSSSNMEGYHFTGWNTKADGSGVSYSDGQFVGITGNLTLYAQWSNMCTLTYMHTNHTNLYSDDETGHMECYNLWISGTCMPKFGKFSEGSVTTYQIAYGTRVGVVISNYNPSELTYDDCNCDIYFNGQNVASGYKEALYEFTLTSDTTVDFRWKIAGSITTFNAKSWEDCYITTY